jgi:hypothetical protein
MPFQIPTPPKSTTKSIRFPNEVIAQVNEAIIGTDCDFTKFIVAAARAALEDLERQENVETE